MNVVEDLPILVLVTLVGLVIRHVTVYIKVDPVLLFMLVTELDLDFSVTHFSVMRVVVVVVTLFEGLLEEELAVRKHQLVTVIGRAVTLIPAGSMARIVLNALDRSDSWARAKSLTLSPE